MNKKEIKQKVLEEKKEELLRFELTGEYITARINQGEKERKDNLLRLQKIIKELKKLIKFLGK